MLVVAATLTCLEEDPDAAGEVRMVPVACSAVVHCVSSAATSLTLPPYTPAAPSLRSILFQFVPAWLHVNPPLSNSHASLGTLLLLY